MKYLTRNLYDKVSSLGGEKYEEEWNTRYKLWLSELDKISHRFPKSFLKEFLKYHMHDNILNSMILEKREMKSRVAYDMVLDFSDYHIPSVRHQMKFIGIGNLKTDLKFGSFAGSCDWIYCEILPVNEKRMSFEILLFSDSTLYVDFSKLQYKKIIN